MRAPDDVTTSRAPRRSRRRRIWVVVAIALVIVVLASLKSLATLWTDSMWFSSIGQHRVWSTLLGVKVGLFAAFGALFFVAMWVNLIACDRLAGVPATDAEDELVRRYQHAVRPYAGRVYAAIAVVLALIAASGTIGEWQNWILFRNATSFHQTDPQFGRDLGYFIFKLPFESFVVSWVFVSLVVILVVTVVFHYLNGGIRAQRVRPRVRPAVKAHLSLLLALIAFDKAAAYYLQRFSLDNAQDGYVNGAGYTDVHARLPAYDLLIVVSICVGVLLLINTRWQGWTLPVIAVGVWLFVALVVGEIYPALLQAIHVGPNQSTLEKTYIQRNISATRAAYGLDHVAVKSFNGAPAAPGSGSLDASVPTLDNIRQWDPDPSISLTTFQKQQNVRSYYTFQSLGVDRYMVNGQLRPVLIGVREIDPTGIPNPTWVSTHLQYTHGEGVALAPANQSSASGNPNYTIQNVPASSSEGLPVITQPDVYFGLNQTSYVVANTKQPELDYPLPNGNNATTHYSSTGGVRAGGLLSRAAFALRLGDLNLLLSGQVTDNSRIMFVRDPVAMAEKAAPFLSYDHDPYAAIVDGHIDWIIDAYTTTANYPYSQNADTQNLPPYSGLPASFNYVRNSVKVVVDAYTGKITFYAVDPKDPILQAYEKAFPGLFTQITPSTPYLRQLEAHFRYPEDIFAVQASIYGRYHLTNASAFYSGGNAWSVTPTSGLGQSFQSTIETIDGEQYIGPPLPMSPLYQVFQEPGTDGQQFTELDAYVPQVVTNPTAQNLTGFLIAQSDPKDYGQLAVYVTPPDQTVQGPAQAEAKMSQFPGVSSEISLLDQHGSSVILGNILIIPLQQSVLYVRPMYVTSSNSQPQLVYVIAEYNGHVGFQSTLDAALNQALGTSLGTSSSSSSSPSPSPSPSSLPAGSSTVAGYIAQAQSDYQAAQAALKSGDLSGYAQDISAMEAAVAQAQQALAAAAKTTTTTTTTTVPPSKGSGASGASSGSSGTSGTKSSSTTSATTPSSHPASSTTTTKPGEA